MKRKILILFLLLTVFMNIDVIYANIETQPHNAGNDQSQKIESGKNLSTDNTTNIFESFLNKLMPWFDSFQFNWIHKEQNSSLKPLSKKDVEKKSK